MDLWLEAYNQVSLLLDFFRPSTLDHQVSERLFSLWQHLYLVAKFHVLNYGLAPSRIPSRNYSIFRTARKPIFPHQTTRLPERLSKCALAPTRDNREGRVKIAERIEGRVEGRVPAWAPTGICRQDGKWHYTEMKGNAQTELRNMKQLSTNSKSGRNSGQTPRA